MIIRMSEKSKRKTGLKLIQLILLFSFLIRLYHINFPVSGWHSWRQSDTASIAKNFYENGNSILYPQIDWGGKTAGYVESEFQLFPYLVSVLYGVFGVNDFFGRFLSVIFSLFTIYGLYLLVRKIIDETTALWLAFIYAVIPLNIFYSRAFMPESMMLMCIVFGIFYFLLWLEEQKWDRFILSALFISLSILLKIPTLYIGLPLLYLAVQKYGKRVLANASLWFYAAVVLVPVVLWYYHAHQLYFQTGLSFGIWGFGEDKWGNFNLLINPEFYNRLFFMSIAERHLTYAGFIPFIIGLFIKREHTNEKLFDYWLISVIIYFLIVSGGNYAHEYYQLPFVLPAAVFAAKSFKKYLPLKNIPEAFKTNRLRYVFFALCLILIPVLSYLRFANFMGGENKNSPIFEMTDEIKSISSKNDLIVTLCDGNPVYLYLADRKGWFIIPPHFSIDEVTKLKSEGARYVIGEKSFLKSEENKEALEELAARFMMIKNNSNYFILKLTGD
jgi:4-amino-4-deoxy-L-arabinose transferase-like glycosyltransferase